MNFGSAVMAPEVFLKALAMVRNVACRNATEAAAFTTLVCDLHDLPPGYRCEASKDNPDYITSGRGRPCWFALWPTVEQVTMLKETTPLRSPGSGPQLELLRPESKDGPAWREQVNLLAECLNGLCTTVEQDVHIETDQALDLWCDTTEVVRQAERVIYLIGNGASASMASHFAADLAKNADLHTQVFTDTSLMTAIANDLSYDMVFVAPLRRRLKAGDMVVAISSSGQLSQCAQGRRVRRLAKGDGGDPECHAAEQCPAPNGGLELLATRRYVRHGRDGARRDLALLDGQGLSARPMMRSESGTE